jgi:hypothetical protein
MNVIEDHYKMEMHIFSTKDKNYGRISENQN